MNEPDIDSVAIVAGRGSYPLIVARAARRHVSRLSVVAIRGDTDTPIDEVADRTDWIYAGQLNKAITLIRKQGIHHVIFAGQIRPSRLFTDLRPDFRLFRLLMKLKVRNAESMFSAVAKEFLDDGIEVLPATTFIEDLLAKSGTLGRVKPKTGHLADIAFGTKIAAEMTRLNIGQTVVVKKGTVLAVEAFEGTDKAILRGGAMGKGSVVVKMARHNKDMRFDVPCVGTRTVESLTTARAGAIAVQADKTLILEPETVVTALNKAGIAIVGFSPDHEL